MCMIGIMNYIIHFHPEYARLFSLDEYSKYYGMMSNHGVLMLYPYVRGWLRIVNGLDNTEHNFKYG